MSVYHHHQSWQNGHVRLFSFSNAGDDDAGAANLKSFVATVQSEHRIHASLKYEKSFREHKKWNSQVLF